MGINNKEFEENNIWPNRPVWILEYPKVDKELLNTRQSDKSSDTVAEYYRRRDAYIRSIFRFLQMDQKKEMQRA